MFLLKHLLIFSVIFVSWYACTLILRRKTLKFYPIFGYWSKYDDLPEGFEKAWEWVEENLAKKKPYRQDRCPVCHRDTKGHYHFKYTFGGWTWTDTDRHHIMYSHVKNGESYYMPDKSFVDMIMATYAERHPRNVSCIIGC